MAILIKITQSFNLLNNSNIQMKAFKFLYWLYCVENADSPLDQKWTFSVFFTRYGKVI